MKIVLALLFLALSGLPLIGGFSRLAAQESAEPAAVLGNVPDNNDLEENCAEVYGTDPATTCDILRPRLVEPQDLGDGWVLIDHLPGICEVANETNVIITFRNTGNASIERILAGHPTKGHDILEKSLKESRLEPLARREIIDLPDPARFYPDAWLSETGTVKGAALVQNIRDLSVMGLVGWWLPLPSSPDGCLGKKGMEAGECIPVGIYTVASACSPDDSDVVVPEGGCRTTFREIAASGSDEIPDGYTGDYDLHDLIPIGPSVWPGHRIPSALDKTRNTQWLFLAGRGESITRVCDVGSECAPGQQQCLCMPLKGAHDDYGRYYEHCSDYVPELRVSCELNKRLGAYKTCNVKDYAPSHCNPIRHGPQANYFEFAMASGEPLIVDLVNVDKMIAVVEPLRHLDPRRYTSQDCRYYVLGEEGNRGPAITQLKALYRLAARGAGAKAERRGWGLQPEVVAAGRKDDKTLALLDELADKSKKRWFATSIEEFPTSIQMIQEEGASVKACTELLYRYEKLKTYANRIEVKPTERQSARLENVRELLCTTACDIELKDKIAWRSMNAGVCGSTAPPFVKTVFVTSGAYSGDLVTEAIKLGFDGVTGLEAGDFICNHHAQSAGLEGSYVAWLSDSSTDAKDRLTTGGWSLVNGDPVAADISDLLDGEIDNPIFIDETGIDFSFNTGVRTGTNAKGVGRGGRCYSWTDSRMKIWSWDGSPSSMNSQWTYSGEGGCSYLRGLYCFGL